MIQISNISKRFSEKLLYENVNLSLQSGNRYALIGNNGTGKTIFLRMLSGLEQADSGNVSFASTFKIGYLPQEQEETGDFTPIEYMLEPFKEMLEFLENPQAHAAADLEKYSEMLDKIHINDVYTLNSRAATILAGLGITNEMQTKNIREFSGGYRMRALLARLLLLSPDFLLLDEPTNHLDMDTVIWLENFLGKFGGGMLIISHDKAFLDRICTHTLEISGKQVIEYKGNVSKYREWRTSQEETEEKRAKNLQEQIDRNERFVERFKSKATKASQAQSRIKLLEKLREELPEQHCFDAKLSFRIPPATPCGSVPFRCENLSIGYENKEKNETKTVLKDFDLTITKGQKIAIIGPNGAGKSTLLKTFASAIKPLGGKFLIGHNAQIRYFSQYRLDMLNPSKTLYETVVEVLGENRPTEVRKLLGSFLFSGNEVQKLVGVCSGGEKSRLSLLLMLIHPGNIILLDEPTNHLDMPSIESVASALAEYDGTIISVSHDENFVNTISDRIIEVRDGFLRDFPGTLTEYREYIEKGWISNVGAGFARPTDKISDNLGRQTLPLQDTKNLDKEDRIKTREEKKKIVRKIDNIEKQIAEQEKKIAQKQQELDDASFANNAKKLVEIQKEIDKLKSEEESLMEEWQEYQVKLELSEKSDC
ncbi:MAG: ABC-F family ATP-binding cassette domain-containing protein [Chitinivibrionia bacterium]|nr:ABC-F family ATP-binding cassette domain-containing protein [Chitinivibrionia bacterium]